MSALRRIAEPSATIERLDEESDLADLVELCANHARYERSAFDPEGLMTRLRGALGRGRVMAWLARSSEPVSGQSLPALGFATASLEFSTWRGDDYCHLDCLYLSPDARGHGLGRRLIDTVAAEARRLGCSEMQWQTPTWNERAIAFYERLGADHTAKRRFRWQLRP